MSTPSKFLKSLPLSTLERKLGLLGGSALVLALGVANASAQPITDQILSRGQTGAIEAPTPDAFIYQPHRGR